MKPSPKLKARNRAVIVRAPALSFVRGGSPISPPDEVDHDYGFPIIIIKTPTPSRR
jgi:hypothetical protein